MTNRAFTFQCTRILPDKPTQNGNVYTAECLKFIVAMAQPAIVQRHLLGRMGQTANPVRLSDASHIVTGLWLDENCSLSARVEVVTSECGNLLLQQINALGEDSFEIVPCGAATVAVDAEGRRIVDGESYKLQALDVCLKRGVAGKPADNVKAVKTVKLRIPIVVDEQGNCYATGWRQADSEHDDPGYDDMEEQARGCHYASYAEQSPKTVVTRWTTIEVPLPESESEIPGIVQAEACPDEVDA